MNEQEIRDALRALADDPGPVDEASAWQQVRAGIARDRRRGRRRAALALSGLAAAGAAAAGVLVLTGDGDDREAVEIGPADRTTVPLTGFPEHPLAVVVEVDGAQRLDLYDADTGAPVTVGLASSVHSLSDVSITISGTVYFTEEFGDSSVVRSVPWDGSADPVTPFGAEETDTSSPTLSPDGGTFAYIRQGPSTAEPTVVLIDTQTGERREIAADPPGGLASLEFAPGGDRLVVVLDGAPMVIDAEATTLAGAIVLGDVDDAGEAHWESSGGVIVSSICCEPDFVGPFELHDLTIDGPGSLPLPEIDGLVAFDVDRQLSIAAVRSDGSLVLTDLDGNLREIPVDGAARDVGY